MRRAGGRARTVWVAALLALAGCATDPLNGPEPRHPVHGSWTWVRSVGGIAGHALTPASRGESVRDTFEAP